MGNEGPEIAAEAELTRRALVDLALGDPGPAGADAARALPRLGGVKSLVPYFCRRFLAAPPGPALDAARDRAFRLLRPLTDVSPADLAAVAALEKSPDPRMAAWAAAWVKGRTDKVAAAEVGRRAGEGRKAEADQLAGPAPKGAAAFLAHFETRRNTSSERFGAFYDLAADPDGPAWLLRAAADPTRPDVQEYLVQRLGDPPNAKRPDWLIGLDDGPLAAHADLARRSLADLILNAPDLQARRAVHALGRLGHAERVLPEMARRAVDAPAAAASYRVANALMLVTDTSPATLALVRSLEDSPMKPIAHAAVAWRMDREADAGRGETYALAHLRDPDPEHRLQYLQRLEVNARTVPAMVERLASDADARVRWTAATQLGATDAGAAGLLDALADARDADTIAWAVRGLLSDESKRLERAAAVAEWVGGPDPHRRDAALRAYADDPLAPYQPLAETRRLLAHPDPRVRRLAAAAVAAVRREYDLGPVTAAQFAAARALTVDDPASLASPIPPAARFTGEVPPPPAAPPADGLRTAAFSMGFAGWSWAATAAVAALALLLAALRRDPLIRPVEVGAVR